MPLLFVPTHRYPFESRYIFVTNRFLCGSKCNVSNLNVSEFRRQIPFFLVPIRNVVSVSLRLQNDVIGEIRLTTCSLLIWYIPFGPP